MLTNLRMAKKIHRDFVDCRITFLVHLNGSPYHQFLAVVKSFLSAEKCIPFEFTVGPRYNVSPGRSRLYRLVPRQKSALSSGAQAVVGSIVWCPGSSGLYRLGVSEAQKQRRPEMSDRGYALYSEPPPFPFCSLQRILV